jgi:hypothetical protein
VAKPGRKSDFDEEVAKAIIKRIENGASMREIGRDPAFPHDSTIRRWRDEHPQFARECARADESRGDIIVDELEDIENKLMNGSLAPDVARVVISSKQWRASKLNDRKYGTKSTNSLVGPNGGPVQVESSTRIDASLLAPEDRAALKNLLLSATVNEGEK